MSSYRGEEAGGHKTFRMSFQLRMPASVWSSVTIGRQDTFFSINSLAAVSMGTSAVAETGSRLMT